MFLNLLDRDEKHAFALLAEKMIQQDGLVVGREAAAVAAMRAEMGIDRAERVDRSVRELAATFASRRSKIAALLELIGLGYSDTSYSVSERSLATQVAREMGIADDELGTLGGLVRRHVELIREALVLMRE